jgi:uncharacterized protein
MTNFRLHPFWRLLFFALGAIGLSALFALVINLGVQTASRVTGQPQSAIEFAQSNILLVKLLSYPLLLLWLYASRRIFDRASWRSLGLHLEGVAPGLLFGAAAGALAITLLFGVLLLTGLLSLHDPYLTQDFLLDGPLRAFSILAFYAFTFFAVGYMEEVIFRGYILQNLASWMGLRAAIVIQAVLFALVHLGNVALPDESGKVPNLAQSLWDARWAMLNITLIGIFFALCYLKSGSLWWPIGFHAAWNFFLGCVWSLPVSGIEVYRVLDVQIASDSTLTGGVFGPEGSFLLTPLLLVLLWMVRELPDHPQSRADFAVLKAPPLPVAEPAAEKTTIENEPPRPSRFRTSMRPQQAGPEVDAREAGIAPEPSPVGVTTWTPRTEPSPEPVASVNNAAFQVDVTQTVTKTEPAIQEIQLPPSVAPVSDVSTQVAAPAVETTAVEIVEEKIAIEQPESAPEIAPQPTPEPSTPTESAIPAKKPRPKW